MAADVKITMSALVKMAAVNNFVLILKARINVAASQGLSFFLIRNNVLLKKHETISLPHTMTLPQIHLPIRMTYHCHKSSPMYPKNVDQASLVVTAFSRAAIV